MPGGTSIRRLRRPFASPETPIAARTFRTHSAPTGSELGRGGPVDSQGGGRLVIACRFCRPRGLLSN